MSADHALRDQAGIDLLVSARATSDDAEAAARAVIAAAPSLGLLRAAQRLLSAGAEATGQRGGSLTEDDELWVRATLRGKPSLSKISTEEMRAMRTAGSSVTEIAEAAGISRGSVYNRLGENA